MDSRTIILDESNEIEIEIYSWNKDSDDHEILIWKKGEVVARAYTESHTLARLAQRALEAHNDQ